MVYPSSETAGSDGSSSPTFLGTLTVLHCGCIKMVPMDLFAGQRREQACGPCVGGGGWEN